MESQKLQELMRDNLNNLPNKAHRVVEYLLANMREAAFISIGDVAEELNVSKAQLVRVARMLGFKGYSDLKEALKAAVLEQVNPAALLSKAIGSQSDLSVQIRQIEQANLEDTWQRLDHDDIIAFCNMIKESNNVYCTGWGISGMVAETMYSRLRELGLNGVLMRPAPITLIEQARGIKKNDMVIACDLPSYAIYVTEAVEKAKSNGAKVVSITDSPGAPICRYADLSFYVSDNSPTFGSSLIGPVFLVHILSSMLSVELGDTARLALEEQTKCLHDQRVYHPIFGLRY